MCVCVHTNSSYYYQPLLTIYRRNEHSYPYSLSMGTDHLRHPRGPRILYDKIGSQDVVEKLWDWLDSEEHKVFLDHSRHTHHPNYNGKRSILTNVSLKQLIKVINHDVPISNWPTTKFNNKGCTAGHIKLYYEYAQALKLKDKIVELEGKSTRSTHSPTLQCNRRSQHYRH